MCINIFTRMGVHRKKVKLKEVVRWGYIPFLTKKRGSGLQENNCREVISLLYWRRQWHPTPVLLPGKSHGRRSLVGCSPWGREESDTTERLHFHFSLSFIGGNGNPLQCSCLENPRDGGAWWAAVYGVTQRGTRLKWLSSSSSSSLLSVKFTDPRSLNLPLR